MMGKSGQKTKSEWLQDIVNDYIAASQPWPADRRHARSLGHPT